jgi:hypothetical protein
METETRRQPEPKNWLTLTDYSSKYRVSISTLRRRIKSNQVEHQFSGGKYLLADEAPMHDDFHFEPSSPAAEAHTHSHEPAAHSMSEKLHAAADAGFDAEPMLSTATKLLNELKKAYMSNLQEKEEQMILLKEEVADLKTLVRVLEQENDRLQLRHLRLNQ